MAHIIQVGAGSGGMPVLDMLACDTRINKVTLIEPDVYKPHNVERHLFPKSSLGQKKADVARTWLLDRRDDLAVDILPVDLLDDEQQAVIEKAVQAADVGICAADNEPAKYHWDALMRKFRKPWTLGEVLSGGIGGFVHIFEPGGPCYGCVASHLQRVEVDKTGSPDYSQPGGAVHETRIPASKASITSIASLHALLTLQFLDDTSSCDRGFTSLLWSLQSVPDVFEEAFRPYRFSIPRADTCLICAEKPDLSNATEEELDTAVEQALDRLSGKQK